MLWETLVSSRAMKQHFSLASSGTEDVDLALLESLVECYNNATQWHTRRQILSIMVDKVSFKSLQRLIPNLTHYRFKIAKQHLLLHGRGCSVPRPTQTRMYVSPEMVDHRLHNQSAYRSRFTIWTETPIFVVRSSFRSTQCNQSTDSGAYSTTIPRVLQGIRHNLLEPKIFASNS